MDKALDWQSRGREFELCWGKMKVVDVRREMNQEGGLFIKE